jgi:hypothetical protein
LLSLIAPNQGSATDLSRLVSDLKQGGYVIVLRHVATDDRQQDVYPFQFENMAAQRQLSDKGRENARQLGAAFSRLGIPIGDVYTSKLNRAAETGKLVSGKEVMTSAQLTDSGAGSASAMARPGGGGNAELGRALCQLANTAPKSGTNTILVTHKTNIGDAFGKDFGDVQEGEASIFKPSPSGEPSLVARVKAVELVQDSN